MEGPKEPRPRAPDHVSRGRQAATDAAPYVAIVWLLASLGAGFVGLYMLSGEGVTNTTLLTAVALGGAAGAAVQATAAVATFVGNREYAPRWTLYFILRPIIGSAVAVVVYVFLRLAFVQGDAPPSALNYYGIAVLAVLSGLMSGSVVRSMTSAFDALFDRRAGADAIRSHRDAGLNPIREFNPFKGSFNYRLKGGPRPGTQLLEVWLEHGYLSEVESRHAGPLSATKGGEDYTGSPTRVPIDIGEGARPRVTTFRVNVFAAQCEVEPAFAELEVRRDSQRSPSYAFVLTCPVTPGSTSAFLELTQHGRTVAVVPLESGGK